MMRKRKEQGQALVEFVLVLPVFVLLLVSIFDLGHAIWSNDALSNAAREGARYAIVHGTNSGAPATKQQVKNVAIEWAASAATSVNVTVCYWSINQCAGDVDEANATEDRGMKVSVTVTANVPLAVPAFFGLGSVSLSSTSTMLVNF
jgi:Flp pilus assembly protein TadG